MDPAQLIASPILFVPGFVALWCLISMGISLVGWRRLATHFRVEQLPPGPRIWLHRLSLSLASYSGVVQARVLPEGLGLKVLFPFRVGHPPLLVPWAACGPLQVNKVFWNTSYGITIHTPAGGSISLEFDSEKLCGALESWLPAA